MYVMLDHDNGLASAVEGRVIRCSHEKSQCQPIYLINPSEEDQKSQIR